MVYHLAYGTYSVERFAKGVISRRKHSSISFRDMRSPSKRAWPLEDISDVPPDAVAEVHLPAYKQRIRRPCGIVTSLREVTDERRASPITRAWASPRRSAELPN